MAEDRRPPSQPAGSTARRFEEIPADQLRIIRRDKLKFHLTRLGARTLRRLGLAGPQEGRTRQFCPAPWTETCVLSDGSVVCSCFDVFKQIPLGNVRDSSFADIWNGAAYRRLRRKMLKDPNQVYWCSKNCPFKVDVEPGGEIPFTETVAPNLPRRINVEPTVECNLDCPGCPRLACLPTRRQRYMSLDVYCKLIDELGASLKTLNFFDYGETFLHPQVYEMLEHTKKVNDGIYIHASTNGHFFGTEEERKRLVASGIDQVMFSIDGATAETYSIYRRGGDFELVMRNLRALVETRARMNSSTPEVMWRYILFRGNDGDEEMDRARRMARESGVDVFCFYLTDTPPGAPSERFVPGTPDYERIKSELFVPG